MAKEAVRTISIRVNDVEPTKSINEIKKRIKELTKATDDVKEKNEQYYKDIAEIGQLKGALSNHRKQIRRISKGWDETKSKVDGYGKKQGGLIDGFGQVLSKGKAAWLAVGAAVGLAAKKGFDFLKSNAQLKKDLDKVFDVSDAALNRIRGTVKALEKSYDVTSEGIQNATASINNNLGGDAQDNIEFLEKGILLADKAAGELVEQVQEYAPVAAEAQISTENFIAQLVKAQQMGVRADYGAAAIEEALLRLREMPKSTQDALDAIGLSSSQIRRIIEKEGIGAAIETVAAQLDTLEDDAPEVGQALADIFGASGEKAGLAYVKSLKNIGGSLDELMNTTDNYTKLQKRQFEFTKNLEIVKGGLADTIGKAVFPALANLVGAAKDYIEVPLSKSLESERQELNNLVGALSSNIENQELKNDLINELNEKYPSFLKNIDIEKLTAEQLADRLEDVNNQYLSKIVLQRMDEKIAKEIEKQADIRDKRKNKALELDAKLAEIAKEYNFEYEKGADVTEKVAAARKKLREADNGLGVALNQALRYQKTLTSLYGDGSRAFSGLVDVNNEYEKQANLIKKLNAEKEKERQSLIDEGLLTIDEPTEDKKEDDDDKTTRSNFVPVTTQKDIDENAKNLEKLREQIAQFREEQRLAQLDDNTKELEQIRAKYDEQIELAKSLNATDEVIALEELKNAEIEAAHDRHIEAIIQSEEEALEKQLELLDEEIEAEEQRLEEQQEEKLQKEQEYQAKKRELQETVNLELMSDLERELAALDAHYDALIAEAEEYGIELSQIKELQAQKEAKRQELQNKAQDKADEKQLEKFKERVNERAQSFQALGSIFGSVAQLMVDEEGNALAAQRVFALAEIAMNAATGIAQAISAGAGVPFPGNLAAIAMGVGAVTTGIAQARKVFQQKKEGRWLDATGKDDNKTYKAKYIGKQQTGMLPSHPVVMDSQVLASEEGQEYFVSNKSLQNPAIMDLVQTIDNIENRRFTQFRDGGMNGGSISNDNSLLSSLYEIMLELNTNLKNGVAVNIGFKEIEKMNSLSDDLNKIQ